MFETNSIMQEDRTGQKVQIPTREDMMHDMKEEDNNVDATDGELLADEVDDDAKYRKLGEIIMGPEPTLDEAGEFMTELEYIQKRKEFYALPEYKDATLVIVRFYLSLIFVGIIVYWFSFVAFCKRAKVRG